MAVWPATAAESQLSAEDRALALAAFQAMDAGKWADGRVLAGQVSDPLAAKVLIWRDLARDAKTGDFAQVRGFIEANPDWPRLGTLRLRAERVLPDELSGDELVTWFDANPPITGAAALRYAQALADSGDKLRLDRLAPALWIGLDFKAADEKAFRAAFKTQLTKDHEIARLERLLRENKRVAAGRQAQHMGAGYAALADARSRLANRRGGVDAAIGRVPEHLQDDPGLLYERVRWRLRKRRYDGVVELLDPPRADLPEPALWWPLRHWAARRAIERGDHEVAYRIAAGHGTRNGVIFAEAEWLAGWTALTYLDDPAQALGHFKRLFQSVTSPISLSRGAFWAGRAAASQGDQTNATWWFERAAAHDETYYGQLAAERLGWTLSFEAPPLVPPVAARRAAFEQDELVRVVRLLGELDQTKTQASFLRHLRRRAAEQKNYDLVEALARDVGRADLALLTAKDARRTGRVLWPALYPNPPLAANGPLERALVLAVIRQESAFYPRAISRAGARGLMQLMPGTAKLVSKQLQIPYKRDKLTDDPAYNLRLGQAYLADMLARYDDTLYMALAAYNAGPHRVDRWIKTYGDPRKGDLDQIDWIELIPFNETRNYVQRIQETMRVYRHIAPERRAEVTRLP